MSGLSSEPFAAGGERSELLRHYLSGLRKQTEELERRASLVDAFDEAPVLGADAGLLSPLEASVPALVEAVGGGGRAEADGTADADWQQRCIAAVVEGRHDGFHRLVRRRVSCAVDAAKRPDDASAAEACQSSLIINNIVVVIIIIFFP